MNEWPNSAQILYLLQGECKVSRNPNEVISTILGSCIAACLYDRTLGIGGMNHFLLPDGDGLNSDTKYAAFAMETLLNALLTQGAVRNRITAKLYGGARMIEGLTNIGARNAYSAEQFLLLERIPIVERDINGTSARRVKFHATTGMSQVTRIESPKLPQAEVPQRAKYGEITFF